MRKSTNIKRSLVDIIVCPVCKGKLELTVTGENEREIVSGLLYCPDCRIKYDVTDTVPNLLPPDPRDYPESSPAGR